MVVYFGFMADRARVRHKEDHLLRRDVYAETCSSRRSSASKSEGNRTRLAYSSVNAIVEYSRDDKASEWRVRSSEITEQIWWTMSGN